MKENSSSALNPNPCMRAVGVAILLAASTSARSESEPAKVTTTNAAPVLQQSQVTLSPGDVVSFRIAEDQAPAVTLTVTDTGEMEVPYIGRVSAAKKTCRKLAEEIKLRLEAEYYHHATVTLGIDSFRRANTERAYITGQVRNAGPIPLADGEKTTVSQAILKAGGFSDFAERRRVKVMRATDKPGVVDTLYVDVLAVWEKGRQEKDVEIKPGDQIFVSSKLINF